MFRSINHTDLKALPNFVPFRHFVFSQKMPMVNCYLQGFCKFSFIKEGSSHSYRDSSVRLATGGLDYPGIESRWVARFSAPVQTGRGAFPVYYTVGTVSFPGFKRPGLEVDHPPPSRTEVKETARFLLHLWAFVACSKADFTFPTLKVC
jgi:hypothetical protein